MKRKQLYKQAEQWKSKIANDDKTKQCQEKKGAAVVPVLDFSLCGTRATEAATTTATAAETARAAEATELARVHVVYYSKGETAASGI